MVCDVITTFYIVVNVGIVISVCFAGDGVELFVRVE